MNPFEPIPPRTMECLPDQALAQVANYFSALSEPTRLKILNVLRSGEKNVGELALACQCSQANVSRHLTLLAKQGMVLRKSRGTAAYYEIASSTIFALCDLVCANVSQQLTAQVSLLQTKT